MLQKSKKTNSVFTRFIFTALLFSILFSSCTKKTSQQEVNQLDSQTTAQSKSDNLCITATFYPLYIMLLNITDGAQGIELSLLAPANTGCLHDYQLTTKDMAAIEKCDILVMNGAGMEDFIEKAIALKKNAAIIAGDGFPLVDDNSHIWVSPSGAIYETKKITEGLCKLNPENESLYTKNAAIYIDKLENLKAEMHKTLDQYSGETIITFHEAFPYFASEFSFNIGAIIEREPGSEPTTKELMDVIDTIEELKKTNKKVALFAEEQYSSTAAEVISNETGCKVMELDPAVSGKLEKDAYIDAMRKNEFVLSAAFTD